MVNGQGFPPGVGDSAKKAKQNAAKNALRHLDEKENLRPGVKRQQTEEAANNPTAPVHQKCVRANLETLFSNYGRMNIRTGQSIRPEPNNATP